MAPGPGFRLLALLALACGGEIRAAEPLRLMTLDPAHFHAALVQKEMYDGVAPRAMVFAPLGPDLIDYLKRLAQFNLRASQPTAWELEIHCERDYLQRLLRQPPGGVLVLSGRNHLKRERIEAAIGAGFHLLADKPWTLASADIPRIEAALAQAERKGLVAYDIMTERYEITSMLARELVGDARVFGTPLPGTAAQPGVRMESVHHILKLVASVPALRPVSFFNVDEQGEGLSDVGTHLVDLVPWTLFPGRALDYRRDIQVLAATRWPTLLSKEQFRRVTGEADFPPPLARWVEGGTLRYGCNNEVSYTLLGVHVQLRALWNFEAAAGAGDTYEAAFSGSRARVEIRQGQAERFRPELYLVPAAGRAPADLRDAAEARLRAVAAAYPKVSVVAEAGRVRIDIPEALRVGHEAHFAQVTRQFFRYLAEPRSVPAWEKPNLLAKYWVTTRAVEMSRHAAR